MRISLVLAVAGCLGFTPAAAQDENPAEPTDQDWAEMHQCLETVREAGGSRATCVGSISGPCLETPGNESTVMMGACLNKEAVMWDDLLNDIYQGLMDTLDEEMQARLRSGQRAWLTVRDETCELEMAQWDGGTGAGPALVECLMTETGHRTAQLMDILDMAAAR